MAVLIRMPLLSDTMEEGNVLSWLKKVGDKIKVGDILAQVETDKATMDLESYEDGVLLHIVVEKGKVAVDAPLAVIGQAGEDFHALLQGTNTKTAPEKAVSPSSESSVVAEKKVELPAGIIPIRMPLLSDTMTEGKIVAWTKKIGDKIREDDVLAEVETDKATMEVQGYAEGELLYQAVEAGNSVKINGLLAIVGPVGTKLDSAIIAQLSSDLPEKSSTASSTNPASPVKTQTEQVQAQTSKKQLSCVEVESSSRIKASPLAKRLARERGIDLRKVVGSGDEGRIIRRDVENWQEEAQVVFGANKADEIVPLSQMRSVIAKRLLQSKSESPHFYVSVSAEMSKIMEARKMLNAEREGVKISVNDMVLKATALALKLHPGLNSSWRGDYILRYGNINIAVAMATDDGGLLVPVVRNADQKSLTQISAEVKTFAKKAKEKKLQPSDWADNTFTVSNLGMFGVENFCAIINPPDVAILAVGGIIPQPVVKDNQIVVGQMMNLTVSADHRAVDGAMVASFLNTLKGYLEEPLRML